MNARTLIAVASATLLTACAAGNLVLNERYFPRLVLVPLASKVNVSVDEGTIVVNREPFKVKAVGTPPAEVTIIFKLTEPGWEFAPTEMSPNPLKWVPIKKSQALDTTTCVFGNDGVDKTELSCKFTPKGTNQFYSYTLRLKNPSGEFKESDPSMMN